MTQPILLKNGISIAVVAAGEALTASIAAIASLLVAVNAAGLSIRVHAVPLMIAAVIICLVLIRQPPDAGSQLSIDPLRAAFLAFLRFALIVALLFLLGSQSLPELVERRAFWMWALITGPCLMLLTLCVSTAMQRFLLSAISNRKAVFAGYNHVSIELAKKLEADPSLRLRGIGFFDDRSARRLGIEDDSQLKGSLNELSEFAKHNGVDVIFVSLPLRHLKRVMDLLDNLRDTTASVYYVPDIFVFDLIQARSTEIGGIPVVAMCETPFYGYRWISKRLLDITVASMALLLLSPVFILASLAVKLSSRGPVIFKQRRYGLDGREILVYKFRSMRATDNGAVVKQASKDDQRITAVGRFLRKSSIDELPQLINVLQGKMSLVGPRPHAVAHNEEYRKLIKGYMVRHKVPPGITGLAQVSGCRGETARLEDMQARVHYDIEYLRHWSLGLDIKILFLTALQIFRDKQAY